MYSAVRGFRDTPACRCTTRIQNRPFPSCARAQLGGKTSHRTCPHTPFHRPHARDMGRPLVIAKGFAAEMGCTVRRVLTNATVRPRCC